MHLWEVKASSLLNCWDPIAQRKKKEWSPSWKRRGQRVSLEANKTRRSRQGGLRESADGERGDD